MTRRLFVVAMLCVSACGGGSPTSPTQPTTNTKIIFIENPLNFGDVLVGTSQERTVRIYNQGNAALTVSGLTGPSDIIASWTSGAIAPNNGFQEIRFRFTPTQNRTYNGTLTVTADHTSGTNTTTVTARGVREPFTRSGVGNTVFDMPTDVARVRIVATYNQNSSNFIVKIGGRLIVNELMGTAWGQTRYDGTHLTGGGGVVEITNSSGVAWSFEEQR